MEATCVNLAARFGRDYKVTHDPAARTRGRIHGREHAVG